MIAALVAARGVATAGTPAVGSVYKCQAPGGAAVYQDTHCPEGRELRDFTADPATVSVIPFSGSGAPAPRNAPPRTRDKAKPEHAKAASARGDATERKHVREGMSEGEVLTRLGAPDVTSGKSGKVRWTYLPVAGDPATITTLRLESGRVVAVERSLVR